MFVYTIVGGGSYMLKDRGTIKWTSLMLPEHVQLLKDLWKEDKIKKRPIIDDQTLDMMNEQLINAYVHKQLVRITFSHNGHEQSVCGTIITLDKYSQSIILQSKLDKRMILCKDIISIKTA